MPEFNIELFIKNIHYFPPQKIINIKSDYIWQRVQARTVLAGYLTCIRKPIRFFWGNYLFWSLLSQTARYWTHNILGFSIIPISPTWLRFILPLTRKWYVSLKVKLIYETEIESHDWFCNDKNNYSIFSLLKIPKQHVIINRNIFIVCLMCEHLQISPYLGRSDRSHQNLSKYYKFLKKLCGDREEVALNTM